MCSPQLGQGDGFAGDIRSGGAGAVDNRPRVRRQGDIVRTRAQLGHGGGASVEEQVVFEQTGPNIHRPSARAGDTDRDAGESVRQGGQVSGIQVKAAGCAGPDTDRRAGRNRPQRQCACAGDRVGSSRQNKIRSGDRDRPASKIRAAQSQCVGAREPHRVAAPIRDCNRSREAIACCRQGNRIAAGVERGRPGDRQRPVLSDGAGRDRDA